ncbi:MAG: hypothetical protein PUB42_04595 [Firmicutes bacterium]|nr:hypothetical protein [Bacillota bacterium]
MPTNKTAWDAVNVVFLIENITSSDTVKLSFDYNNGGAYNRGLRTGIGGDWNTDLLSFKSDGTVTLNGNNEAKLTYDVSGWVNVTMYMIGQTTTFVTVLTDDKGNKQTAIGYTTKTIGNIPMFQIKSQAVGENGTLSPWGFDNISLSVLDGMSWWNEFSNDSQDFSNIENMSGDMQFTNIGNSSCYTKVEGDIGGKPADDKALRMAYSGPASSNAQIKHSIFAGSENVSKLYSVDFCNEDSYVGKSIQFVVGGTSYIIYVNNNGTITYEYINADGNKSWPQLATVAFGLWYHLDVLIDTDQNITIYINGKQVGQYAMTTAGALDAVNYFIWGKNDSDASKVAWDIDNTYFATGTKDELLTKIKTPNIPNGQVKFFEQNFNGELDANTAPSSFWISGIDGTINTTAAEEAGSAKADGNKAFYIRTTGYQAQESDEKQFTDPFIDMNADKVNIFNYAFPFTYEVSIKAPSVSVEGQATAAANIGTKQDDESNMYSVFDLRAQGDIYVNDKKYGTWVPGEWYNFAITMTPGTDKVTYYMNGDLLAQDDTFVGGRYDSINRLKCFTLVSPVEGTEVNSEVAFDDIIAYRGEYDNSASFDVTSTEYKIEGNKIFVNFGDSTLRATNFKQKIAATNDAEIEVYEDSAFDTTASIVTAGNIVAITSKDGKIVKYYEVEDIKNRIELSQSTLQPGEKLTASAIVDSGSVIMIAVYNESGALLNVYPNIATEDGECKAEAVVQENAVKATAMIWDSFEHMIPQGVHQTIEVE